MPFSSGTLPPATLPWNPVLQTPVSPLFGDTTALTKAFGRPTKAVVYLRSARE
jgi:hypothetical protein